jgi:hypothetical protein
LALRRVFHYLLHVRNATPIVCLAAVGFIACEAPEDARPAAAVSGHAAGFCHGSR